jgi:hypothetical protein
MLTIYVTATNAHGSASAESDGFGPITAALASSLEWGFIAVSVPVGTDNGWVKIAEVKFFDETDTDITASATMSAYSSFTPAGWTPDKLVDGNAATFWLSGAAPHAVNAKVEGMFADPRKVCRITIQAPADVTNGAPPDELKFGYWIGGIYTQLTNPTGLSWTDGETKSCTIQ